MTWEVAGEGNLVFKVILSDTGSSRLTWANGAALTPIYAGYFFVDLIPVIWEAVTPAEKMPPQTRSQWASPGACFIDE